MNLELRKEREEKKGIPRKQHFILLLFFSNNKISQVIVILQVIKPQLLVALDTFQSPLTTVRPPSFNPDFSITFKS